MLSVVVVLLNGEADLAQIGGTKAAGGGRPHALDCWKNNTGAHEQYANDRQQFNEANPGAGKAHCDQRLSVHGNTWIHLTFTQKQTDWSNCRHLWFLVNLAWSRTVTSSANWASFVGINDFIIIITDRWIAGTIVTLVKAPTTRICPTTIRASVLVRIKCQPFCEIIAAFIAARSRVFAECGTCRNLRRSFTGSKEQ
ncbi:MAG TPA: hypothetical protein VE988_25415 [Gemmataceae bacterium]|nr:hypothetical protein [Gemmataceae bacterium]